MQIKFFSISLSQRLILNRFDLISAELVKQEEMEKLIDNEKRLSISGYLITKSCLVKRVTGKEITFFHFLVNRVFTSFSKFPQQTN